MVFILSAFLILAVEYVCVNHVFLQLKEKQKSMLNSFQIQPMKLKIMTATVMTICTIHNLIVFNAEESVFLYS